MLASILSARFIFVTNLSNKADFLTALCLCPCRSLCHTILTVCGTVKIGNVYFGYFCHFPCFFPLFINVFINKKCDMCCCHVLIIPLFRMTLCYPVHWIMKLSSYRHMGGGELASRHHDDRIETGPLLSRQYSTHNKYIISHFYSLTRQKLLSHGYMQYISSYFIHILIYTTPLLLSMSLLLESDISMK